jgi:hypothetical protein
MKAAAYGHFLPFALRRRVESTKMASRVLLPLLKPNCSCPRRELASAASVMWVHILTVSSRRRFDGMVMGLYWQGCKESPP